MFDIIGKMIATILAFIILFMGPAVDMTLASDLAMQRGTYNEVVNFIDKVRDSGTINDVERADFILGCSSYGAVTDVEIRRLVKLTAPDGMGGTKDVYSLVDDTAKFNKGDMITVRLKVIDYTGAQRLVFRIMNVFTPKFEFTLSGKVRN